MFVDKVTSRPFFKQVYEKAQSVLAWLAKWAIILFLPYILMVGPARIALQPWIVPFQYALPWIPPDEFGFTREQRLQYGVLGVQAVIGKDGVGILNRPKFPDGSPVFNQREIKHLADVAVVTRWMWPLHTFLTIMFGMAILLLWLLHRDKTLGQALLNGGKLTLVIVGFILIFAIFAWDWAFTTFHKLFFTGDSWLFYIDDTLIRLYPVEFWITCTMMIGVVVIVMSLLMITMGKWILKRQKHA